MPNISDLSDSMVFNDHNDQVMKDRLPKDTCESVKKLLKMTSHVIVALPIL
jgi:hypothetical protein